MNKAYIIHGWGANPESDWFPWLKKQLEDLNFHVEIPEMPNTEEPKIKDWVEKLSKTISPDEHVFLIGHSIGCQTILRYLEALEEGKKIKSIVLVAPWLNINYTNLDDKEKEIAKPWAESKIDLIKVKSHVDDVTIIYSSTDPFSLIEDIIEMEEKLEAIAIDLGEKGHLNAEAGITELPIIIDNISEIINETHEEIE